MCEYLCERGAYSCCAPSAIYLLLRAEAARGSFTHFSRLDVESHLRRVQPLGHNLQIQLKRKIGTIDSCNIQSAVRLELV